ncbi:MAG: radical SAM protein, partial [Planctomycetota bacterium]|nr:radical SAM protein [Planctomycetota bacterium]
MNKKCSQQEKGEGAGFNSILEDIASKTDRAFIPLSVLLEITRLCNLNCRHCYRIENKRRKEMSRHRILMLIGELRQAGCLFLTLSGGEPLLHSFFVEICQGVARQNLALQIFSNGTSFSRPVIKELSSLNNIFSIHISLYGANAQTHDYITGQKGSYYKTINNISLLQEAGLNIRFNYIMMKNNVNELKDMVSLAERMRVRFDIDPLITPRDNGDRTPLSFALEDKDLET